MKPNLIERTRYRIDNVFAGGPRGQLLVLGTLSVGVIALGMTAYFVGLFDRDVAGVRRGIDSGFWDTLWWSAKHIVDPATFDLDYGARIPVVIVSLLVSLMGMVIFASFIGLISAAVEEKIGALNRGRSAVIESDHVLILGWNNRVFPIIDMLEQLKVRRKIVALADKEIEAMREGLRVNCSSRRRRSVVLRTGSPTSIVELRRVAFDRAFSIIVLADESDGLRSEPDVGVIKTLMLLSSHEPPEGTARPKIVAEITKSENVDIAEVAGQRRIPLVCTSQTIGRVLVQTARQPGLAALYAHLFSGDGSQIYIQGFPQCTGMRFRDTMHCFRGAIPLGVSSKRRDSSDGFVTYVPRLNPPVDHVIDENEWIILLSDRVTNEFLFDAKMPSLPPHDPASVRRQMTIERVVILGWNGGLYQMLQDFDEYAQCGATVLVVASHDEPTATALIAREIREPFRKIKFKYLRADYLHRVDLERVMRDKPNCICILRDESEEGSDPDARVIMASVLVRDHQSQLRDVGSRSHVVAEVSSPQNRELLERTTSFDVVAGPEIASWLLAQVSQQLMLLRVYDDLLNAGGNEIYLKTATRYVSPGASATFAQIMEGANRQGEIAIGIVRSKRRDWAGDTILEPLINPPRDQSLSFGADDKVIVIAEGLAVEATADTAGARSRVMAT